MKLLAIPALAAAVCLMCASGADAQINVPPGEQFYATPMSHGGLALPLGRIVTPEAAAPAPLAEPVAPVVKRKRRRR